MSSQSAKQSKQAKKVPKSDEEEEEDAEMHGEGDLIEQGLDSEDELGEGDDEGDEGDDDEVDEATLQEMVKLADAKVKEEPENYDAHANLVKALRNACMFDELRAARQTMQNKFPLPPEVWKQWLEDEKQMAGNKEEKRKVLDLCALAVQDYLSAPIWTIYLTLACEVCFDGDTVDEKEVPTFRAIFNRATEEMGCHLTHGHTIWMMYLAFENTLASFQKNPDVANNQEIVRKLWKAQLEHPLINVEEALQEYKSWEKELDANFALDAETGQNYKRSAADLTLRVPFEEAVAEARAVKTTGPGEATPALSDAWAKYLEFEMKESKKKNAVRVKVLFERALTDMFLSLDLWLQYLAFLQQYYRKAGLLSSVYTRASRNCPWSGKLWGGFIQSLLNNGEEAQAEGVFERAMGTSLVSAGDFIDLCLVMVQYYRERANVGDVYKLNDEGASLNDNPNVVKLRGVLERVNAYLSFLPEDDPFDYHYSLLGMWATLEATCLGNLTKAREVWKLFVEAKRGDWRGWLDYAAMERVYGDVASCRAVYKEAMAEVTGPLYALLELAKASLKFERQSGDFDHVDKAQRRAEKLMQQVRAATAAVNELEEKAAKKKPGKEGKEKGKEGKDRHNKEEGKKEKRPKREIQEGERSKSGPRSNGKGTDDSNSSSSSSSSIRGSTGTAVSRGEDNKPQKRGREQALEFLSDIKTEEEEKQVRKEDGFAVPALPVKRQKFSEGDDHDESGGGFTRLKGDQSGRTVFVLNLAWGVSEDDLSNFFSTLGAVKETLHVRDSKGNSKGFGYVQYESKDSADAAIMKLDGAALQGRKLTVTASQAKPPVRDDQQDKRTVYVKGIPRVQNVKELLMKKFSSCGPVADIRLAKDHDGNLKKFAFVEFASEESVDAALRMDGSLLTTKEEEQAANKEDAAREATAVALQIIRSKAPTQREKKQKIKSAKRPDDVEPTRAKVNHKLQLLPRALQRPIQAPSIKPTVPEKEGTTEPSPLSNADFKALLSKRS